MANRTAKDLAHQFYAELEVASAAGADALRALIRKWYADNAEQNEAGEQPTKGLEAIIARESVYYDNYFDWTVKIDAPLYKILSIHGDATATFTHHTFKAAFKGAGVISGEQLTEQHWDVKSGKIVKEVFWHVKKN